MPAIVMTVIGTDRPGLVESLARTVARNGGNWLESRMAHLGGQFAGILLVDVPAGQADQLVSELEALDRQGLSVIIQKDSASSATDQASVLILEIVGNDHPGIVRDVTRILAELQVNVEEFDTDCIAAPMSGGRIFRATAKLRLPDGVTRTQIQQQLEEIAHDLMVDISLAEPSS